MKNQHILIAGGGLGGLAAALALARSGQRITVLERVAAFAEVGAGIQLGPNAMKLLSAWGLRDALLAQASQPEAITLRDAGTGRRLSRILLGEAVQQRYGQVYVSLQRSHLHAVLLQAVLREPGIQLVCDAAVHSVTQNISEVIVSSPAVHSAEMQGMPEVQHTWQGDALIAADGLWSNVRQTVFGDGVPHATGHAAYRALIPMAQVPALLRGAEVGLWWGRDVHVVHYPVRSGAFLNLVVLSEQAAARAVSGWACDASAEAITHNVGAACSELRSLLACVGDSAQPHAAPTSSPWQSWHLYDRPSAHTWVQGRVALLGDAAHPMLPYLAQGAAMALEDAAVLASCVGAHSDWANALQHYQSLRKARCERVVRTARRYGHIFHLAPPWSIARDAVLALRGGQVLGMPWLYGAGIATTAQSALP